MPPHERAPGPDVAFCLPHLGGGGAEKMIATLANGLAGRGYHVEMVLVQATGVHLQTLSPLVYVVDLHARNSYLAFPPLISYLRRRQPSVLVSSLPLTNALATIACWLARSKARLAIRMENINSAQRRSPLKKSLEKHLLAWLYPHADRIIAVSHAVAEDAEDYLRLPASRIDVIYNPVLDAVRDQSSDSALIHPWFADGCPPVVLAVGRLVPAKDFPTLLKAFAEVHRQRSARLMILGEGEERSALLALARALQVDDAVQLPGFVSNPLAFMRRSDVFVLSSLFEGLPTVLIEALASGCAVVTTDSPGGAREILARGRYGELVPVGDAHAMAAAITRILDGQRKLVDPAWLDQFTFDTVLDQTIEVLGLSPLADRA